MRGIEHRPDQLPSDSPSAPPGREATPAALPGRGSDATGTDRPDPAKSPRTSPWIRVGLLALAVVAADRLSKEVVEQSITPGETRRFLPGVQLVNTRNHGVAFGFLPGSHLAVTILIVLALAALVAYFAIHSTQRLIWLPT